jgi:hypothetical protein
MWPYSGMWDFKFSRRRVWCSELSSGIYRRAKWLSTDVSEVRTASIIRDATWLWRQYSHFLSDYTAQHLRRQPSCNHLGFQYHAQLAVMNPDVRVTSHPGQSLRGIDGWSNSNIRSCFSVSTVAWEPVYAYMDKTLWKFQCNNARLPWQPVSQAIVTFPSELSHSLLGSRHAKVSLYNGTLNVSVGEADCSLNTEPCFPKQQECDVGEQVN